MHRSSGSTPRLCNGCGCPSTLCMRQSPTQTRRSVTESVVGLSIHSNTCLNTPHPEHDRSVVYRTFFPASSRLTSSTQSLIPTYTGTARPNPRRRHAIGSSLHLPRPQPTTRGKHIPTGATYHIKTHDRIPVCMQGLKPGCGHQGSRSPGIAQTEARAKHEYRT